MEMHDHSPVWICSNVTPPSQTRIRRQKVVLNYRNLKLYPTNKYYRLNTATSYHVHRTDATTPQLHLFVHDTPDTLSDSAIHKLLRQNREDITSENWYIGATVYNLFATDPLLAKLPDTCGQHLAANIKSRKKITRGKVRNDSNPAATMVGVGAQRVDKRGEVGNWSNFKTKINENQKYVLEEGCDETFDVLLNVLLLFHALIW